MEPSVTMEEAQARLKEAGWATEETVVANAQAWDWLVVARRGGQKLEARAATQRDAWQRVWHQSQTPELLPAQ